MILSYNGVDLPTRHSHTVRYDEDVVLGEDRSYLGTRYTLGVRIVFGRDLRPKVARTEGGEPKELTEDEFARPTNIMNRIRELLEEPGKKLKFVDEEGNVLVESPREQEFLDDEGGPTPQRVSVGLFSPHSFVVDFVITTFLSCAEPWWFEGEDGAGVIRNYWSIDIGYDQDWYAKYTVSGQIILSRARQEREDFVVGGERDPFRASIMNQLYVSVPPNFERTGWRYVTNRDGTIINYQFEDSQAYLLPPKPATTFDGYYSESTGDGVNTYGEGYITLSGPPHVTRDQLTIQALRVMGVYLGSVGAGKWGDGRLQGAAVRFPFRKNAVEIRARVLRDPAESIEDALIGTPMKHYDLFRSETGSRVNQPGPYGNYPLSFLHAALKKICKPDAGTAFIGKQDLQQNQLPTQDLPASMPTSDGVTRYPSLRREKTDGGQQQAPYTKYLIDSQYVRKYSRFVFPRCGETQSGGGVSEAGEGGIYPDAGAKPAVVIQTANPVIFRLCRWEAQRVGIDPEIPRAETLDESEILVMSDMRPSAPQLDNQGVTELRKITGVYAYAVETVPSELKSGNPKYTKREQVAKISGQSKQDNIIS